MTIRARLRWQPSSSAPPSRPTGPPYEKFRRYLADNPYVRFFEGRARGYVSIEVSPDRMTAQYRATPGRP